MHTSVGKKLKMLITNVYTFKKKSTFTADYLYKTIIANKQGCFITGKKKNDNSVLQNIYSTFTHKMQWFASIFHLNIQDGEQKLSLDL